MFGKISQHLAAYRLDTIGVIPHVIGLWEELRNRGKLSWCEVLYAPAAPLSHICMLDR